MRGVIAAAIGCSMIAGPLWAKLPPPTEEQKAAAAAKAAKAAEAAKKDAELLSKSIDMTAEKYRNGLAAKAKGAAPAMATPAAAKK